MKQCAWCLKYFTSDVSYQIYCEQECRVEATKQKSKDRARAATIKRRKKKVRVCSNKNCNTRLSIYNDNSYCSSCDGSDKKVKEIMKEMKDFFNE